jgi:hypothetical protein
MQGIDYDDIYRGTGRKDSISDFVDRSFAPHSIRLGYLDTIGKNDASSLINAVQHASNAAQARESEAANRMEQQEQRQFETIQQDQKSLHAANSNARMMLLQKSNEITRQINDIYKAYDYTTNPRKYTNALNELTRQKAEIDSQLEAATEAVKGSSMHQGETLVNPVTARPPITAMPSEIEGEMNTAGNFLAEKFGSISEAELDRTTPDKLYDALREQAPGLQMSRDEFNKIYGDYYGYYKDPHNRAAETLKRNMSVSNEIQKHQIQSLENQVALAQALSGAKDLENAKEIMLSLGIKEHSPFWNFGIKHHGNAALQFLGGAAVSIAGPKQEATQPQQKTGGISDRIPIVKD